MTPSRVHGCYALYDTLGVGGAATVHLGVSRGREVLPVAIKRLHDRQSRQTAAVAGLLDEVRLSRHVIHPNVIRIIDFVSDGEEMLAVMEYVHGEPLSRLLADVAAGGAVRTPARIAAAIACDVLQGLHAAHVATDHEGRALSLVHRDVTPENILVGADGMARLMDFGVAKAQGRLNATKDGGVRGKLAYLAPEQVGGEVTARTDLYAVGLVLWEMLVGERAIAGESEPELLVKALDPQIPAPSARAPAIPRSLDAVVLRAVCKEVDGRFGSAEEQARAVAGACDVASPEEVSEWVRVHGGARLAARDATIREMLAAEAAIPAVTTSPAVVSSSPAAARARGFAIMGLATLAVVVVGIAYGSREPQTSSAPSPEPPVANAAVPAPDVPPPVLPTAPAAPSVSPPSASALPSPSPSIVAVPSPRRVIPPVPRQAQPSCDPPWVLDSKGIRRYDPACVK